MIHKYAAQEGSPLPHLSIAWHFPFFYLFLSIGMILTGTEVTGKPIYDPGVILPYHVPEPSKVGEGHNDLLCEITIEDLIITPISDCGEEDGGLQIKVNREGLEFSLDAGVTFQSSPVFTGLPSGTYSLLIRSLIDPTCNLTREFVILDPTYCPLCSPMPNLAIGKVATQSSTYGNGIAGFAVDGNKVGDHPWGGSANLQHTQKEASAWWKVDLDTTYNLDYLKIYNRTDFGGFRLKEFYLYFSEQDIAPELGHDSLQADPNISYIYFSETAGAEEMISLGAQHARYVMIKLTKTEFLHMAEVEIYGCEAVRASTCGMSFDSVRVALPGGCQRSNGVIEIDASSDSPLSSPPLFSIDSGRTYQSIPRFDGLTPGSYHLFIRSAHEATCEVEYAGNPLVLPDTSAVQLLDVTSTPVTHCDSPNGTATISAIGEHLAYSLDGGIQFQSSPYFFGLEKGTYRVVVRDSLKPDCHLEDTIVVLQSALCDPLICEGGINVALGKNAVQSSIYGGGGPSLAVDGNTTGSTPWGASANLVHTQASHNPWWKVDLGSIHSLDSIRIFNRSNCCANRLNNFYVFISSTDIDASLSIDTLLDDSSLTSYFFPGNASMLTSLSFSEQAGRYLVVKLPGESQILHIAEFEVYGCRIEPTCTVQIDSFLVSDPTDCGLSDGSVWIQALGDSLEYSIDGGLTYLPSPHFSNLEGGMYPVFVREVNDTLCITSDTFFVQALSPPSITSVEARRPTDCGVSDGSIHIQASGDSLEYSIDAGLSYLSSPIFSNLKGGTYPFFVREVNNPLCISIDSIILQAISPPIINTIEATSPTDCGIEDGSILIQASGDSLEYSIDLGMSYQLAPVFLELDSGAYTIYVREVGTEGCIDSIQTFLDAPSSCTEQSDCSTPLNLALGKPASQSSTYGNGVAGIAVDGILVGDSPWGDATIQHTNTEVSPWWQVNLKAPARLDSLRLFNRIDCCQGRLKNFYVFASRDSLDGSRTLSDLLSDSTIASFFYPGKPGMEATVDLHQVRGQYVMVKLGEEEETLHTSEIEVYGCYGGETTCTVQIDSVVVSPPSKCGINDAEIQILASGEGIEYSIDGGENFQYSSIFTQLRPGTYSIEVRKIIQWECSALASVGIAELSDCGGENCDAPINLAMGKITSQSSTYGNGFSDLAVDGITTGSTPWGDAPDLQHTDTEDDPWWKVDLGGTATLSEVQLFNRTNCCQDRLEDFYIFTSLKDIDGTKSVDSLINDPTIQYLYFSGRAGLVESIDLEQVQGRFLLLKLVGENRTLHTVEIEVYGCTASPSQKFLPPSEPLIREEQGETLNARVQPNPFKGSTALHWDQSVEVEEVYITNVLGQIVWWSEGNDVGALKIGEELSEGVYWVHIHGAIETQIIKVLKVN